MSSPTSKIPVPRSLASLDLPSPIPTSTSTSNPTTPGNKETNHNRPPASTTTTILTRTSLPATTRKSLLTHLQSTDSISPLNDLLTRTLTRSTTTDPRGAADWSARVHALALELLRSGACAPSFQDLMSEINRRALSAASAPPPPPPAGAAPGAGLRGGGEGREGKVGRVGTIVLPNGSYGDDGLPDVRVPGQVVEKGLRYLEDRVRGHVEIVEGESGAEEDE